MSGSSAREQVQRLIFRCISEAVIQAAGRLCERFDGDLTQGLVFIALADTASEQGVSIRGIAGSISVPPETIRRRMNSLVASGDAVRVRRGGYAASAQAMNSTLEAARRVEDVAALQGSLSKLSALGYRLREIAIPSADCAPTAIRLISHAFDAFLLRSIKCGPPVHGDAINTVIFMALLYLNAAPVTYDRTLAWKYAGRSTPPPDGMLRPVIAAEVAESLAMAPLTVRRRLSAMAALGRCDRVKGGYVASRAFVEEPATLQTGLLVSQYFEQMLEKLHVDMS